MAIMINRIFRRILPAVVLVGGLGGFITLNSALAQDAATQSASDTGGQRTDGQIEMDVVHSLDGAPELKLDMITAGTVQGEVTLSGTSATEANRQLAESLASKV